MANKSREGLVTEARCALCAEHGSAHVGRPIRIKEAVLPNRWGVLTRVQRVTNRPGTSRGSTGAIMKKWAIAIVALLTGCAGTVDSFPLNIAAKNLGPLKASFVRTGTGQGPVTITMADGEVLKGQYRVAFGTAQGFAFSGGRTSSALVITDGPVQFVATGPKTQLLCRGNSTTMGHGSGQCQTYDGAVWAISW